jgi:hypothetical protein
VCVPGRPGASRCHWAALAEVRSARGGLGFTPKLPPPQASGGLGFTPKLPPPQASGGLGFTPKLPPPQASGGLGFTPKLPPPQAYSLARITARLESPCCRGSPSISLAAPSAALVRVSVRARVREKECRVARICTHTRDKAQRHMSSESLHAARRARTRRRPGEGAARAGEEGGLCDMCGTVCATACTTCAAQYAAQHAPQHAY